MTTARPAGVEESLIKVEPPSPWSAPPARGNRKPILFGSRKMATAKRELSAWEQLPAAGFPRKNFCKPELLPLSEALEHLRVSAEWEHVRITVPAGYSEQRFQHRAWTYALRIGLNVRMRTRPGQLHIQNIPQSQRRRRRRKA